MAKTKLPENLSLFPADVPAEDTREEDVAREGKYILDPQDGLRIECVKQHSEKKHKLVRDYVDICRAVRRRWPRSTYIDLYCGPGRVLVEGSSKPSDSSATGAWNSSVHPSKGAAQPLTDVFIADDDPINVDAARQRLERLGAPVHEYIGPAEKTVNDVVQALPNNAFHFAFLDPYGLRPLPFTVVERLARVPRLDLLIHVSVSDMRRNLGFFLQGKNKHLDSFSPRWRERYDKSQSDDANLRSIIQGWCSDIAALGKPLHGMERIAIGDRPLYWLVMLSASPRAMEFWEEVRKLGEQRPLMV